LWSDARASFLWVSASGTDARYVLTVALVVNQRQASIVDARLRARGKLRNATLGTLLGRVEQMRRDARWRAAQGLSGAVRAKELRALRYEYGLTSAGAYRVAFDHWQASGWMPRMFGSRVALAVGSEVLTQVKNWMLGHTAKPSCQASSAMDVIWGNDNQASLRFKDGRVELSSATKRKSLALDVAREWRPGTQKWALHLDGRRVVRVGVKREEVRGRIRYFALICLEGQPYRNPDYLTSVREAVVGLDVGPSLLAVVGTDESVLLDRAPKQLLAQRKSRAAGIRRAQRAIDRSRRAMNPDCYDEQRRAIEGKRPTRTSKRQRRVQGKLRRLARSERVNRQQDAVAVARQVMRLGTTVAFEANSYRSWQGSRYGKRMGFTAPAALMGRIAREAVLAGGRAIEFATSATCAPSQHCLCGHKAKKSLSQRVHACDACGLGRDVRLDRDLFSAYLARLVGQTGCIDLSEGPFLGTDGVRGNAELLCSASVAVPSPDRSRGSVNPADGLVAAEPAGQTPGQHATPRTTRRSRTPRKATSSPALAAP
jgi:putative transposase